MYRNVCTYTKSGQQYIWEATWNKNGDRVEIETPIEPYLYYEDSRFKEADHFSMYGKPVRFLSFKTSFMERKFLK